MNEKLRDSPRSKSTEQLLRIWPRGDAGGRSADEIGLVLALLLERAAEIPRPAQPKVRKSGPAFALLGALLSRGANRNAQA